MNKVQAKLVDEAFRALAADNHQAAARALARAQADVYGMRPWRPGNPTHDALGDALVFKEDGGRYTIPVTWQHGSQIRAHMGDARYVGPFNTFDSRAPTAALAARHAKEYAKAKGLHDVQHTSTCQLPGGQVCITYRHGRSLD